MKKHAKKHVFYKSQLKNNLIFLHQKTVDKNAQVQPKKLPLQKLQ